MSSQVAARTGFVFGGDRYMEWDKPLWEHDRAGGL